MLCIALTMLAKEIRLSLRPSVRLSKFVKKYRIRYREKNTRHVETGSQSRACAVTIT